MKSSTATRCIVEYGLANGIVYRGLYYRSILSELLLAIVYIVTCQRAARQRLDKHPVICARDNRTNVYSSLLGNSVAVYWRDGYHVTSFSVWSALRNNGTVLCSCSMPRGCEEVATSEDSINQFANPNPRLSHRNS
jgi:hypothetical protein